MQLNLDRVGSVSCAGVPEGLQTKREGHRDVEVGGSRRRGASRQEMKRGKWEDSSAIPTRSQGNPRMLPKRSTRLLACLRVSACSVLDGCMDPSTVKIPGVPRSGVHGDFRVRQLLSSVKKHLLDLAGIKHTTEWIPGSCARSRRIHFYNLVKWMFKSNMATLVRHDFKIVANRRLPGGRSSKSQCSAAITS